jgi:hypothetical protein
MMSWSICFPLFLTSRHWPGTSKTAEVVVGAAIEGVTTPHWWDDNIEVDKFDDGEEETC